jgi:transposase
LACPPLRDVRVCRLKASVWTSAQTGASNQRCELTDFAWAAIGPFLSEQTERHSRVDDRRVLEACPPARSRGEHPAETKSQRSDLLQLVSAPRAKLDRTVFNKIKQCRPVATGYDKLAANHVAVIKLASIRICLRADETATQCLQEIKARRRRT